MRISFLSEPKEVASRDLLLAQFVNPPIFVRNWKIRRGYPKSHDRYCLLIPQRDGRVAIFNAGNGFLDERYPWIAGCDCKGCSEDAANQQSAQFSALTRKMGVDSLLGVL